MLKKFIFLVFVSFISLNSFSQSSDPNWGCKVLLCLANPDGAEAVSQCVQPIESLWQALAHFEPFPTCNMVDGSGNLGVSNSNNASNEFYDATNCPTEYLIDSFQGDGSSNWTECHAKGVIRVIVNGALYKQIVWFTDGTPAITVFDASQNNFSK